MSRIAITFTDNGRIEHDGWYSTSDGWLTVEPGASPGLSLTPPARTIHYPAHVIRKVEVTP